MMLFLGVALMAVGFVQLIWYVRARGPKHIAAQAMVFVEMGVMFAAGALIRDPFAAATVVIVIGVGALVSLWLQIKLLREWRQTQNP
jgi:hypothetical protein